MRCQTKRQQTTDAALVVIGCALVAAGIATVLLGLSVLATVLFFAGLTIVGPARWLRDRMIGGLEDKAMTEDEALEQYSRPGHDRDCARAMWSQVQHRRPLSQVQVEHLLRIAWTAGATAEHEAMHEGVAEDCRPLFDYTKALAQTGSSGDRFLWCVTRVYGPTLPWRQRLRLAVYLAFRKGYQR